MSDKSERLLKIYSRLKHGPVTLEIIKNWAKKNDIKVSTRTFYRDLKDLETSLMTDDERIVVTEGEKNKKTWKIEYNNSKSGLREFDINSYLLFKNLLPLPVVLSRQQSLKNIEKLFYASYSKSRFENFATVADQQIVGSHFYEVENTKVYQEIREDVIWSIQNKRKVLIQKLRYDYTSISSVPEYPEIFLPVQLIYHRGVLHVGGCLQRSGTLIVLALEQIVDYELTNEMFDSAPVLKKLEQQVLERFGVTENMDDEVYDIELEFSALTGVFVKNQFWHRSQKFETLESGNYLMKLKCGINRELVGWIF